jgi:hypothetical protein
MADNKKAKRKNSKNKSELAITDEKQALLKQSMDYVNAWFAAYSEHLDRARNFLTFLYVDQWDVNQRQAREALGRPTMQFNKLTPIVRGILGEARDNSPALDVRPLSKNVSQKDIDIRNGLLRQISYDSDADVVFQIALKQQLEIGWGAARVITQYKNDKSFEQCIKILPITDYQAAFWDPVASEPDKSDGDFCGVYTVMSMDDFKRLYPKIENPQSASTSGNDYYYLRWNSREIIIVAELYYKDYYTKTIVELSDGTTLDKDEAKEVLDMQQQMLEANPDADLLGYVPLEITNEREVRDYKIKHIKFIHNQVLEETDWPGKILPIVYFEGDSTVIDGEQIPLPYIQDAIDAQRLINYVGSEVAYAILRARKETVIGTPDNFEGFEDQWRNPDKVQGYLEANLDPKTNQLPQFVTPPAFNGQLLDVLNNSTQDLSQILGRYEEARGEQSNAISGKAINSRKEASNKPVNVYINNWERGIKQIGKIIMDLIPHVYDTERDVMIMTPDGASKPVTINQRMGFTFTPDGNFEQYVQHDMTKGDYDIEVRVDGSYDAQQMEALQTLMQLCSLNPTYVGVLADLIAENTGLENTQTIIERLKLVMDPRAVAQEEGKPPPPPPKPQPDPKIISAQLKLQSDMAKNKISEQELALRQQELQQKQQQMILDAQLSGLDYKAAYTKAVAELKKSNNEVKKAQITHMTNLAQGQVKMQQLQKASQNSVSK